MSTNDDTLRALREHARRLREQADRIDEIARPAEPIGTDWLGPCDDEPAPAHAGGSRWGDAALVFAGGIVGAVVGAWSCGGCA